MAQRLRPNSELLGRRRFPDNKGFRQDLYTRANIVKASLQDLLPSNYPNTSDSNLAQWHRVIARELSRLRYDINALNNDKVYTTTRAQYLYQILGERLFLQERLTPRNYNDQSYRDYLINIKNSYLVGSKKENIEETASLISGLDINLRELYLEAREPNSSLDVSDTHKMIVEAFINDTTSQLTQSLVNIAGDLSFYINLIKPAHVLYDLRFIWEELIVVNKIFDVYYGDTGGGCIPIYYCIPFEEPVYFAKSVMVLNGPQNADGRIGSIHHDDLIFFLDDGARIITQPGVNGTKIYDPSGKRVPFTYLEIGQWVALTRVEIPCDFDFWWVPPELDLSSYSRFYPDTIKLPIFQENVKKVMDAQGRFPLQIRTTPTTICDRWVQDLLDPQYEDLRKNCLDETSMAGSHSVTLAERMGFPRLYLPWGGGEVYNDGFLGSSYVFRLPETPLTDGSGGAAMPANIGVTMDGTSLIDSVSSVDATNGYVALTDSTAYWDATGYPTTGDVFHFQYSYSLDGTDTSSSSAQIFGISHYQMPDTPLVKNDGLGTLADTTDVSVSVDGTQIDSAVAYIRPLLGHVSLNDTTGFWISSALGRLPEIGDAIGFSYYHGTGYVYSMLFDDIERHFDTYENDNGASYTAVFDGALNVDPLTESIPDIPDATDVGYRYRAYLLHHSSVLNSPDTLSLNDFQKPALRGSFINQQSAVNHKNLFFSGEFLDDTGNVVLNDQYLENGLDPVLKLKEGTPPFQKTFSYHPDLIHMRNLPTIREHRSPLLYSDLLLKEFRDEGNSVPLSSICDSAAPRFQIRYTETIPSIEECDPWILFDDYTVDQTSITLPGVTEGVPHLRVPGVRLRDNLVLRERSDTGILTVTYTETPGYLKTDYQLPQTIETIISDGTTVDFPALPIMSSDGTSLATINDITVKIDGTEVSGLIQSFDASTGEISLYSAEGLTITDHIFLTAQDVRVGQVCLSHYPADSTNVAMNIIKGTSQFEGTDFTVSGRKLTWRYGPLDGLLAAGDELRIIYSKNVLDSVVSFTYYIQNEQTINILDEVSSRILDYIYVFGSACPDPIKMVGTIKYNEYVNFLDDYSAGIKMSFFNKDTKQIEEHVFSGPVFESYDPDEDEISSPDSFQNALVKIPSPIHSENPLTYNVDYQFLDDVAVRFRHKTYRELLPDRTFRELKITEMQAV